MQRIHATLGFWAFVFWLASGTVWAATQMENLENALMCKCKDKCGKVLINCTCDTSKETRKDLRERLESGLTVKQIVQQYVDKHGETILSAPTKSGFNLSAWVTPFLAIVVGGVGVRQIVKSWLRRKQDTAGGEVPSETTEPAGTPSKTPSRLQRELDRLED